MTSADGKVICCVNGEIYNHIDIKAGCDTEEPPLKHTNLWAARVRIPR